MVRVAVACQPHHLLSLSLFNVVNYRRLQNCHHAHQRSFNSDSKLDHHHFTLHRNPICQEGNTTEQRYFLSPEVKKKKGDRKWSYELLPTNWRHYVAGRQHNTPTWVATIMNPPISVMIAFVEFSYARRLSYRLACFTLSHFSPGMKFYPVVWCTEGLERRNCEGTPPSGSKFNESEYRCQIWWFLSGGG